MFWPQKWGTVAAPQSRRARPGTALLLVAVLAGLTGCRSMPVGEPGFAAASDIPRELCMVSHPEYRVAPPDILLIDAVNNIRPPGTRLQAGNTIQIQLANPEPLVPVDPDASPVEIQFLTESDARAKLLSGEYRIQPSGEVDLGPIYGRVAIAGLTIDDAQRTITAHLQTSAGIKDPQLSVIWPDLAGKQTIAGEHMVQQDGTVSLGIYGRLHVAGMTLREVKTAVELALSPHVLEPEVSVDVLGFNSRAYYVIMDGGGYGEQVRRLPVTGNETVLDAIAAVDGLSQVSSKRIWIARPAPAGTGVAQVLPVNWHEITVEGVTDTNYQVFPGDRIYVQADRLVEFDTIVAKVISPFERIFGFTLLTTSAAQNIKFFNQNGGNNNNNGFGGGF